MRPSAFGNRWIRPAVIPAMLAVGVLVLLVAAHLTLAAADTAAGWLWSRIDPAAPFLAGAGLSLAAIVWLLIARPGRA